MARFDRHYSLGFCRRAMLANGYRESTIEVSLSMLDSFLAFLEKLSIVDIRQVSREDIVAYLGHATENYKPKTVDTHLSMLRRFFTLLYKDSKILDYPMENIRLKPQPSPPKAFFSVQEAIAFLESIDIHQSLGLRDRALFELIYSSALRSSEASGLLVGDLNLESRRVLIRASKNNEDRLLPITATAASFLKLYLPISAPKERVVFLSSKLTRLHGGGINSRFHYWLKRSGLERKGLSVHSLRHSIARHLLAGGAHLRYVQELLGHRSVASTQVYTEAKEENLMRYYRQYHPRENGWFREPGGPYIARVEALEAKMRSHLCL